MNIGFQTSGLSGFTRVAYLWRRHASAVLWIAMAALLPTACSDDAEQSVPQANGHTAVIYLNFKTGASKQAAEMNTSQSSETRAPLTRAIDENGINTVDVLSFKVDPADPTNIKKGTFFYRAQGTYDIGTQKKTGLFRTIDGSRYPEPTVFVAGTRNPDQCGIYGTGRTVGQFG